MTIRKRDYPTSYVMVDSPSVSHIATKPVRDDLTFGETAELVVTARL